MRSLVWVVFSLCLFCLHVDAWALEKGDSLPVFAGQGLDGQAIDLQQVIGKKPVVLVFWASWCPSCKSEVPKLNRLVAKYAAKGMVFVGVNIGANDSPERARAFMQKTAMNYPVLFDQDSSITRRYRVLGVPTIVVANKSGRIVFQGHQVPENFEQELGKLLKN
ncbi:MAG: hypothetical protein BWK76_16970 [Desulfobulbaceae bacterium A2]|nr:MAG: hypothetical protein BWK76_16970 [Desulfobulbaceae bacterium A2]